jgi:hypothetical protein
MHQFIFWHQMKAVRPESALPNKTTRVPKMRALGKIQECLARRKPPDFRDLSTHIRAGRLTTLWRVAVLLEVTRFLVTCHSRWPPGVPRLLDECPSRWTHVQISRHMSIQMGTCPTNSALNGNRSWSLIRTRRYEPLSALIGLTFRFAFCETGSQRASLFWSSRHFS